MLHHYRHYAPVYRTTDAAVSGCREARNDNKKYGIRPDQKRLKYYPSGKFNRQKNNNKWYAIGHLSHISYFFSYQKKKGT